MPTYLYKREDGSTFEIEQRITAPVLKECPTTRQSVTRLISKGAGLIFKGSGFYVTDYVRAPEGSSSSDESGSDQDSASGKDSASSNDSASGGNGGNASEAASANSADGKKSPKSKNSGTRGKSNPKAAGSGSETGGSSG